MEYPKLIRNAEDARSISISPATLQSMAEYWLFVGYCLRGEVEGPRARKKASKESVATGIGIEHQKVPIESLESSKRENEAMLGSAVEGIVRSAPEAPLRARVESVGDTITCCTVYFHGIPLPVAFPTSVIRHHKLIEGSDFDWSRARGRRVLSADIKPVCYDPEVSNEEKERLRKFVQRGRSLEDILSDFDE